MKIMCAEKDPVSRLSYIKVLHIQKGMFSCRSMKDETLHHAHIYAAQIKLFQL